MKGNIYIAVTITVLFLISGVAQARILRVPAQFPTIQDGLNAALTSDTVLVSVGTYQEHIIWPGTDGIHLTSEAGASQTIIDGDYTGRVIEITTGVGRNTEIRDFTIQRGLAGTGGGGTDKGSGIYCEGSSPTITENIITLNGGGAGSGIYCCYGANALIQDNQIIENVGYYGVGIGLRFADPVIIGNNISYNSSPGGWASAIDCYDASPIIIGNTINHNYVWFNGTIYCTRSHSIIQFNDIKYNIADYGICDGIECFYSEDLRINFNNLVGYEYSVYNINASCGDSMNAEYNWWGDPSGPGGFGPGSGVWVSNYVDYTPWQQEPVPLSLLPVVSLPEVSYGAPGDTISIPIVVSELLTEFGVVSAEFTLSFGSSIITGIDVETSGTLLSGTDWEAWHYVIGDTFYVAMAGTDTLAGSGTLVKIVFIVSPDAQQGQESPLHFVDFMFNEGTLAANTQDGVFVVIPVGIEETAGIPKVFALCQNYPNPVRGKTVISYSLPGNGKGAIYDLRLTIYDLSGRVVKTLADGRREPGCYSVTWDGCDNNGRKLASGIYFYRLEAGDYIKTKKLLLLR